MKLNKIVPVHGMKAQGKLEVYLHSFLTLALEEVRDQHYAATVLPPRKVYALRMGLPGP